MIQSGLLLWLVQGFNHIKTLLQQSHYYQLQRGVHLHPPPPTPPKSATDHATQKIIVSGFADGNDQDKAFFFQQQPQ